MTQRLSILAALALTVCLCLRAQQPRVRNFTPQEYHGGTQNWCIAQGPNNRMFFGNNQGLLVFDGDAWVTRYVANYSVVRSVWYDAPNHLVYAGASNDFGFFEPDTLHYTVNYHSLSGLLPQEHRSFGEIWNVFGRGSDVIFQSKTDLFVYNRQTGKVKVCNNGVRQETTALIGGRVIMASREGVFVLQDDSFVPLPGTDVLKGTVVRSILNYGGRTLFVTSDSGIFAYDGQQTLPFQLPVTDYLKENQVFCAALQDHVLALGTVRGGLVVCDLKTGQARFANQDTGLRNNTVLSVLFDRDRNLWLGLDNGLAYVLDASPYADLLSSNSHIGTGYTARLYDGHLYLGTSQGLFVTPYPAAPQPTPPTPQLLPGMTGQVWTLDVIDGTLFCGSDNGAYVVHGMQADRIGGVEGTWNFMPMPRHPGLVLCSDYRGFVILRRQGDTYAMSHRIHGLDISSGGFYVDDDGSLWISHWQKGIYHVWLSDDLTAVSRREFFHKGNGLLMDEGNLLCRIDGRIYVSCVDGLYRYDPPTRKLVYAKPLSQVFDSYGVPLRIFQTPRGHLWAYKPGFLGFARKQKGGGFKADNRTYQRASASMQVGTGDVCYLDGEHTLFNSHDGFFVLNSSYRDQSQPRTTYIRKIVGTNRADTLLYLNMDDRAEGPLVRIPHEENSLRIEFIQTEFRAADAVSYQCLLEGYDREWSQPQTATSKEYTQLPQGSYTFRVRALNNITGTVSETALRIRVLPAWYETWWARLLYLLAAVAAVWQAVRWMKRHAEQKVSRVKAEKERQLREQQAQFSLEQAERENELMRLRAEKLEYQMKDSASKLADSTMNLMRKNDMLLSLDEQMTSLSESVRREEPKASITKRIKEIRRDIQSNIKEDENWEKFEENFNLVYDDYMRKLTARFPDLKLSDRKLCAYLRMGLSSKEMAALLNTTTRSIETARYRLRKKLQMESGDNLQDFIQNFDKES